jgi:hypothetical protein
MLALTGSAVRGFYRRGPSPNAYPADQRQGQVGQSHSLCDHPLDGLVRFIDDGRIELDTNTVERSICPLALNRTNALFTVSDEGGDNWAVVATLIENCKLGGINPHDWLTQTLTALAQGCPANCVQELMPWIDVG